MDQERLRHLPEEKKVQIMNAAFEVFERRLNEFEALVEKLGLA